MLVMVITVCLAFICVAWKLAVWIVNGIINFIVDHMDKN